MKPKDDIIKISKADFVTIGGTANVGAFTNDDGCFVEVGYEAHKEYLKLLADRKNYKRF